MLNPVCFACMQQSSSFHRLQYKFFRTFPKQLDTFALIADLLHFTYTFLHTVRNERIPRWFSAFYPEIPLIDSLCLLNPEKKMNMTFIFLELYMDWQGVDIPVLHTLSKIVVVASLSSSVYLGIHFNIPFLHTAQRKGCLHPGLIHFVDVYMLVFCTVRRPGRGYFLSCRIQLFYQAYLVLRGLFPLSKLFSFIHRGNHFLSTLQNQVLLYV